MAFFKYFFILQLLRSSLSQSKKMCYFRTPTDVRDIIKHAKLCETELTPISQVLNYSEDVPTLENLRLVQLDDHIIDELTVGSTVVFKGSRSDNAVLCTSNRTYDIKEAETSNSLLLVPDLLWGKQTKLDENTSFDKSSDETQNKSIENQSPNTSLNEEIIKSPRNLEYKEVLKVFYTYFEPRPCKPHLSKLNEVLQYTKYSGPEYEYAVDKKLLLTLDQLKDIIQASDTELLKGLDDAQAMEISGFYRILSFEYEFRVLSLMLDLKEENSWELDKILKSDTLETLKELVPKDVLESLFDFYTEKSSFEDDVQYYKYKEDKVCKAFALVLLQSAAKFGLNDFVQAWNEALPEGMIPDEKVLEGIALIDMDSNPQIIKAFYESSLPENINERFKVLFQTKSKWTVKQIAPYIQRFTTDKLNVKALLTKYARGSTFNNVRYFSAKHSK